MRLRIHIDWAPTRNDDSFIFLEKNISSLLVSYADFCSINNKNKINKLSHKCSKSVNLGLLFYNYFHGELELLFTKLFNNEIVIL